MQYTAITGTTVATQKKDCRTTILEFKIRSAKDDPDLPMWIWMREVIVMLDTDGMSSEESNMDEVHKTKVYRVNVQEWRWPELDGYLDIIDNERHVNNSTYKPAGSLPVSQIHSRDENKRSTHKPVYGLPEVLYNSEWLESLDDHECKCMLHISSKPFKWLRIHAEKRPAPPLLPS